MMTLEARGHGATILLMTLTRGEGGQNKFGGEITDELGVLRTLELLEADRYYGVEQRFSRVADFGFSKTASETFEKWGGHEIPLADMVRVIRTFRPDVLVARFQGASRDGHGNHQASGVITREAFRAAGDSNRFPDQIKEGLLPWQAKKLYMDNVHADEDWTLRLDTGSYSPLLGMSYMQFALEGLSHQISQGVGGLRVPPGHRYTYYKLLDSILPKRPAPGEHEKDFFDGLDTSLTGLAARLGSEESKVRGLRASLVKVQKLVDEAAAAIAPEDLSRAAPSLSSGLSIVDGLIAQAQASALSNSAKQELLTELRTKRTQFNRALDLSASVSLEAYVDSGEPAPRPNSFPSPQNTFQFAVPGQTFTVIARMVNRGRQTLQLNSLQLEAPKGWIVRPAHDQHPQSLAPGEESSARFQVAVPDTPQYSRPYWHRENTQEENSVGVTDSRQLTLPFLPDSLRAVAIYKNGTAAGDATISSVVQTKQFDSVRGQLQRPIAVAPAFSVDLEPQSQVLPTLGGDARTVTVGVTSYAKEPVQATVTLNVPAGWKVEPTVQPAKFLREGEHNSYSFRATPGSLREQRYAISAQVTSNGKTYTEGFRTVGRPDIGNYYFYTPARADVSAVRVTVPKQLRIGYIVGAGDDIPSVLKQIGLNVETIPAADLASGDLSRFDTIVIGIRAYDVRTDLCENNRRLLDYVDRGGTLLVQYNQTQSVDTYLPYPATAGNLRVSVEEAKVTVLAPNNPIFNSPNKITANDFDGWVQERGLYFLGQWDAHYTPLLASNDPGEEPLQGGLLEAQYGKGTFLYTGYAFFRQLPAGVPGAIRLFVNLLAAGHSAQ